MSAERWGVRRIGDFATRSKVINVDGAQLPPLSITKDRGVVLQSEKYKKQIATDLRKYVIARRDQFAFDPMSLYYGAIGRVTSIEVGLVSPDYVVFSADNTVDSAFLNYALRSPQQIAAYEAVAETGNQFGKRRRVYWSVLEQLRLSMPPLGEQRKIAEVLSAVDKAIEATQAVIDKLQVVKKAMMTELLTRGIPGRHSNTRQTELGPLPETWATEEIRHLGSVDAGKARDPRGTGPPRPYLRVANVHDGEIRLHDVLEMPFTDREFNRYALTYGDVLLNEGQSLELVGRCSLYRGELGRPCAIQNALLRFRAGPCMVPEFAEQLFRWLQVSGRFMVIATKTTSIAHLGLARFSSLRVQVPPTEEQREIAAVLACIDERAKAERAMLAHAIAAKGALMSVLLTGEVRVTPDEAAT